MHGRDEARLGAQRVDVAGAEPHLVAHARQCHLPLGRLEGDPVDARQPGRDNTDLHASPMLVGESEWLPAEVAPAFNL